MPAPASAPWAGAINTSGNASGNTSGSTAAAAGSTRRRVAGKANAGLGTQGAGQAGMKVRVPTVVALSSAPPVLTVWVQP